MVSWIYAVECKDSASTYDFMEKQFVRISIGPVIEGLNEDKLTDEGTFAYYGDHKEKSLDALIKSMNKVSESSLNNYVIEEYEPKNPNLDIRDFVYYAGEVKNACDFKLTVVKKDGSIIWDMFYFIKDEHSKVVDIASTNKGDMVLYSNSQFITLTYTINIDNKRIYIEYTLPYQLSFIGLSSGWVKEYDLKSAKIISTNIVRVEFDDGRIEYCLVRDKSKKIPTKSLFGDVNPRIEALLWSNNVGDDFGKLNKENCRFFVDKFLFKQNKEPGVKQLKKKFPNDIFFDYVKEDIAKDNNTSKRDEGYSLFLKLYNNFVDYVANIMIRRQV